MWDIWAKSKLVWIKQKHQIWVSLLGQWLNFKLFGITYLVGKISRSNFFPDRVGRVKFRCALQRKSLPVVAGSKKWHPLPCFCEVHEKLHMNPTRSILKPLGTVLNVVPGPEFRETSIWVFPKIGVFPPKSSILIGCSLIFAIHFGVPPIFGNIHIWTPLSERHPNSSWEGTPSNKMTEFKPTHKRPWREWTHGWRYQTTGGQGKFNRPVVKLRIALYGHPDSGGLWEQHCESQLKTIGFVMPDPEGWPSVFYHPKLKLLLVVYVDDFKMLRGMLLQ